MGVEVIETFIFFGLFYIVSVIFMKTFCVHECGFTDERILALFVFTHLVSVNIKAIRVDPERFVSIQNAEMLKFSFCP